MDELTSHKNKLIRDLEINKSKCQSLEKECSEKDRIILNYVNNVQKK